MSAQPPQRPSIIGTGLIALDLVIGLDSAQPAHAWTGGTCGNVLTILSYLGWDAFPIARLNGDAASDLVSADMSQWGVRLDYAFTSPTAATPIIVQMMRRNKQGEPSHRFSWHCPHCGNYLPGFKPVTARSIEHLLSVLAPPKVFFLDRLSRSSLVLAEWASAMGALVVFEPSGKLEPKLLREVLGVAHVVKYADDRVTELGALDVPGSTVLLEIQTSGAQGLRYRQHTTDKGSRWVHLPALPAPRLVDTCGAGDWTTAGLIMKSAEGGLEGFRKLDEADLRESLVFGQALSAWNCGFEGARGGMYRVDKATFENQVRRILYGEQSNEASDSLTREDRPSPLVHCPACSIAHSEVGHGVTVAT